MKRSKESRLGPRRCGRITWSAAERGIAGYRTLGAGIISFITRREIKGRFPGVSGIWGIYKTGGGICRARDD